MWRFKTAARRVHDVLAVAVAMSLLSACSTNVTPVATIPSNSVIRRPVPSRLTPTDSTGAEVRQLVNRFVQAFNAGDQPTLQRLWTRSGHGFEWYSTDAPGQRIDPAGRDRASLGAYFAERHGHREALRLTSFQFNGNAASYGNFEYHLVRHADDLSPTAYVGKGAALCTTMPRTIAVWSMASNPRLSGTSSTKRDG